MRDALDWTQRRRGEILELFEREVYGRVPSPPVDLEITDSRCQRGVLDGLATRKQIRINLSSRESRYSTDLDILLYLPEDRSHMRAPVVLGFNFYGNHTIHPDRGIDVNQNWMRNNSQMGITDNLAREDHRGALRRRWPVERILSRGYGLATIYYGDVDPDFDDGYQNGVHPLFHRTGKSYPAADDPGSIGAWAWGLSRALDCLELDDAVDAGDVQGAIALYRTAAQDHPGDALPVYLEGLTRIQNGEVEEGNALIRRATLYPLAQDARRARLAYGLDLRHHTVEAGQQWQHLWRHAAPDSVYRIDIAPRLAAQKVREKQLYAEAVRDLEVSQLPLLRKNTSVADVTMAVTVRSMIARYQVLEALARNDIAAAHRRLERAKKILPLDIELAIAVHHAVKNGAHEALGQSLFDETFQALQALCKQYPLLAELHNETAWLAARCGKTLDVAEILARRAVSLDPESPEYLDTLAEVLFQGQKREQAILLMQRCIELDPEMPYFQRQLTRFQTGNPSRPPPE